MIAVSLVTIPLDGGLAFVVRRHQVVAPAFQQPPATDTAGAVAGIAEPTLRSVGADSVAGADAVPYISLSDVRRLA